MKRLANPPVFFSLGQVQFNHLLSLGSYMPAIQERFIEAGFPAYTPSSFHVMPVIHAPGGPIMSQQATERHLITNLERTEGFVLQVNSLTYITTSYQDFEHFSTRLKLGLEILLQSLPDTRHLHTVERIGIRYLNAIVPQEGESLHKYLQPRCIGMIDVVEDTSLGHSFTEVNLVRPNVGQVVFRSIIQNSPLTPPVGLLPDDLALADKFNFPPSLHAVLDADAFIQSRNRFTIESIQQQLGCLHDLTDTCFARSVTPEALEIWSV